MIFLSPINRTRYHQASGPGTKNFCAVRMYNPHATQTTKTCAIVAKEVVVVPWGDNVDPPIGVYNCCWKTLAHSTKECPELIDTRVN